LDLGKNVIEQGEAALALEAFEEGGQENFGVVAFGEILKKVAAALEKPETPTDACFKPQRVGKGRAVPTEPGLIETTENGLEEFGPNY
jgi:hypothetical protein